MYCIGQALEEDVARGSEPAALLVSESRLAALSVAEQDRQQLAALPESNRFLPHPPCHPLTLNLAYCGACLLPLCGSAVCDTRHLSCLSRCHLHNFIQYQELLLLLRIKNRPNQPNTKKISSTTNARQAHTCRQTAAHCCFPVGEYVHFPRTPQSARVHKSPRPPVRHKLGAH